MKNMKNRILTLSLLLILSALFLFSCVVGGGSGNGGSGNGDSGGETGGNDENCVYSPDTVPTLIFAEDVGREAKAVLYQAVKAAAGLIPDYSDDTLADAGHEIVIGNTNRSVSAKALKELETVEHESDDEIAYVIYASGNSVAIVYDYDVENLALEYAVDYFAENFVSGCSTLELEPGVLHVGKLSVSAHYAAIDEAELAKKWASLESVAGEEITEAMRELYEIYDSGMISWLANLYDPYIGGFYYSNSARDNVGYLPDAESTFQALHTLASSGMAYKRGGEWTDIITDKMKSEIGSFIKSLQKPDGKFYHPQWEKQYAEGRYDSRLSRDLSWCTSILNALGMSPTYSVLNYDGDGVVVPPKGLTSEIGEDRAALVSRVVLTASYSAHLENETTFRAYLARLLPADAVPGKGSSTGFYSAGNTLNSQMSEIRSRDAKLSVDGADYSLVNILIEWFNTYQNPETGVWSPDNAAYMGTNGLLKIYGVYSKAGRAMPYADRAAVFALNALSSNEAVQWCVDIYNIWAAISGVLGNISSYGEEKVIDGVTLTATDQVMAIRRDLHEIAPEAIRYTMERIVKFKRTDGSFSYNPNKSNSTSQGMPTAVPGSVEGDVNGNSICSTGLVSYIYSALGYSSYFVPIYGESELGMLLRILDKRTPVEKIANEQ